MLSFSVLLLATSGLVGAAVLPQQGGNFVKPTTYKPGFVGRNVDVVYPRDESVVPVVSHLPVQQFQRQPVARNNAPVRPGQNPFLPQQQPQYIQVQPVQQQQPFVQQAQPVYNQVSVQSKNAIVDQGFVQPQQPAVVVEPKHHAVGHDEVVPKQAASARILQQDMDVSPDGSFVNSWNSDNGIQVQEQGTIKQVGDHAVAVQNGEISYVDEEGTTFSIKYVADETGFHVVGDHLPTPPPIPAAIQRSLDFNAAHPFVETNTEPQEQYQPGQQGQEGQYNPGQEGQYQPGQEDQEGQYNPGQEGQYQPGQQGQQGQYQPGQQGQEGQYKPGQQGQYKPGQQGQQGQYQPGQQPGQESPVVLDN